MKNDYLNMLASLVLPAQILDYFLISGVEQTSQEIHISLDEKMNPKLSNDVHFESKGFMEAVNVTDWLSGNFWLVSFKISYLCLPLFHETRTTPSCHPSGCAYRQL